MKTNIPNLNIYELNQFYQNICLEIMKGIQDRRAKDEIDELNRLLWQVHSSLTFKEKQRKKELRALA